jgi:2,3-bisphosphoglycerate-independent phosphoglycerate mutase
MKKIIFIVLDGLADRPNPLMNDKTPLEIAFKPNLDWFTKNGSTGYMFSIKEGIAPESDVAVLSILGYDPYKYYSGRGPLEAFGAGIKIDEGDLCLRTNFATVKGKDILDRRVGRTLTTAEAKIIADAINKRVKMDCPFIFKPTIQHRGVLVVRGSFSDNITNTDPAYEKFGMIPKAVSSNKLRVSEPLDDDEISDFSSDIINNFVYQSTKILKSLALNKARERKGLLPANIILTRDAGIKLPDLPKKNKKWLAILNMPLEIAIAKLAGMDVSVCEYPEMKSRIVYENLYDSLKLYLRCVEEQLEKNYKNYDCFYIHIKETDVPGHDGLPLHKKKMIELIDETFFRFLKAKFKNEIICVTSDHATPCTLKMHSADAVPLLIYGKGKDKVENFDEKSCKKGKLGKIYGKDLQNMLNKG